MTDQTAPVEQWLEKVKATILECFAEDVPQDENEAADILARAAILTLAPEIEAKDAEIARLREALEHIKLGKLIRGHLPTADFVQEFARAALSKGTAHGQ